MILIIWKKVLFVLGNITHIKDPSMNAKAMQCCVDMWQSLIRIRTAQSCHEMFLPPLYEFMVFVIDGCDLSK